jgi:uncharacterized protein (UPF0264 family)
MSKLEFLSDRPGLLVSVRNATEARAALAGGADVIDVKEPERGSLGAADNETISKIVVAVGSRAVVTVARGELAELNQGGNGENQDRLPNGVSLFKVGLANCRDLPDWQARWRQITVATAPVGSGGTLQPVAVVYADWRAARAPSPADVLDLAIGNQCPALLIDTWDKSAGTLFDHWPSDDLRLFLAKVREHGIAVVLAGSLTGENVARAAQLAPDLVAVRTAACDGGRTGAVSENKVRELKSAIKRATKNVAVIESS